MKNINQLLLFNVFIFYVHILYPHDTITSMLLEPDKNIPITNHDVNNMKPYENSIQLEAASVSSPKAYEVRLVNRNDIKQFMETWHYSHSINGLSTRYCFGLYYKNALIGAMIYGKMAMSGQAMKYADTCMKNAYNNGDITMRDIENSVIELRRLACIDDTVRNTESWFIGKTLKWLKKNAPEVRTVISYADTYYGHQGIIYKASNFQLVGQTAPGRVIEWTHVDDDTNETIVSRYHDHVLREKYNGRLKPISLRLKKALDNGSAVYVKTPGKNIYEYRLVNSNAPVYHEPDLFSD